MPCLITPSILSANLAHLQEEVDSVEPYADWLQIDVMDGHFVPNLSFGAPVVASIRTKLPLDIHLMVTNPADRIEEFLKLGVKNITFHAETITATKERRALVEAIRRGGATAGIALKPTTPVSEIDDVIDDIDLVLIMSVEPGFSGQAFLSVVLEKARKLRALYPHLMLQIDGGINPVTAEEARKAGINNLVAASAIFGARNRKDAIDRLRG